MIDKALFKPGFLTGINFPNKTLRIQLTRGLIKNAIKIPRKNGSRVETKFPKKLDESFQKKISLNAIPIINKVPKA